MVLHLKVDHRSYAMTQVHVQRDNENKCKTAATILQLGLSVRADNVNVVPIISHTNNEKQNPIKFFPSTLCSVLNRIYMTKKTVSSNILKDCKLRLKILSK